MCSGRVDLEFVLRAFSNGIDGVFIGGCRLNECNYVTHGNYHALNMTLLCRKIMERLGLDPARLRIEFMSGSEGNVFVEVVDDFIRQIKGLGSLGSESGVNGNTLKSRLVEVRKLIPYIKVMKNEKLATRLTDPNAYTDFYTREEIDELLDKVVSYYIDPEKCQACMICQRRCPAEAIDGGKNRIHFINQDKCIKCGACVEACPPRFGAATKISDRPVPPPVSEKERMLSRNTKEK